MGWRRVRPRFGPVPQAFIPSAYDTPSPAQGCATACRLMCVISRVHEESKNVAYEIMAATMSDNEFEYRPVQQHEAADNDDQQLN